MSTQKDLPAPALSSYARALQPLRLAPRCAGRSRPAWRRSHARATPVLGACRGHQAPPPANGEIKARRRLAVAGAVTALSRKTATRVVPGEGGRRRVASGSVGSPAGRCRPRTCWSPGGGLAATMERQDMPEKTTAEADATAAAVWTRALPPSARTAGAHELPSSIPG